MDALKYLAQQHRVLDALLERIAAPSTTTSEKLALCRRIADLFAVHTATEEKIFYPAIAAARTKEALQTSLEEHLSLKRIIADLVDLQAVDERAAAKMLVLRKQKDLHERHEEEELFPDVREILLPEELEDLGDRMVAMAEELISEGSPRMQVLFETDAAATVDASSVRATLGPEMA